MGQRGVIAFAQTALYFSDPADIGLNINYSALAADGIVATPTSEASKRLKMASYELASLPTYLSYNISITLDMTSLLAKRYYQRITSSAMLSDFALNTMSTNFQQLKFENPSIVNVPEFISSYENSTGKFTMTIAATMPINNNIFSILQTFTGLNIV